MKKMIVVVALFLMMALLVAPAGFAAPPKASQKGSQKASSATGSVKIGIVDMQKILRDSKAAAAARNNLLKDVEKKKEQIIAKTQAVQALEQEIAKQPPTTPTEEQRQKADRLKHEVRELNNLRQDVEEEIKSKDREMGQKIFGEIMLVIRNYAQQERLGLILERSTILTAEEGLDITGKILKLYDSQKK